MTNVSSLHDFFRYLNDSLLEIHGIGVFSEDIMELVYIHIAVDATRPKEKRLRFS